MKKYRIFIFGFLAILLCACDKPKDKVCYEDYTIQSIRIDDDSEYHIVAINSRGEVIELHDCDNGYDIYLRYQKTNKPILRIKYVNWSGQGWTRVDTDGYPQVILPFNYPISTFDD